MSAQPPIRIVRINRTADTRLDDSKSLGAWLGLTVGKALEIAVNEDAIWIRYAATDENVVRIETRLPGQRFVLLNDDQLVPHGSQVATDRLPANLKWSPIDATIDWDLPTAAWAGECPSDSQGHPLPKLGLVRGGTESKSSAAISDRATLSGWLETAPAIRLSGLTYCVDENSTDCLILGDPLPPIRCQHLWQTGPVLLPVGMTWTPQIDVDSVCQAFDVGPNELLLWCGANDWSVIPTNKLMPLSRSSLRTLLASEHGAV